jgi:TPR repeat protein
MAIGAIVMVVIFLQALRFWAEHTANDPDNVRTQLSRANEFYKLGDYNNAIIWLTKAGNQGNTEAQDALGYIYANGKGVNVDTTKAIYWYKLAADQGDYKAHEALKKLNVVTAKPPSFVPGE